VIVVIGTPRSAPAEDGTVTAAGRAVEIAAAATGAGSTVEIAGRLGDDGDGDGVALDLARRGIGHAAVLRVGGLATPRALDALPTLPGPDLELALRYLPTYRVVVVADPLEDEAFAAVAEAATWADAHLIVVAGDDGRPAAANLPPAAVTVFDAPVASGTDGDPGDGGAGDAFAALVGAYAAALDRGEEPGAAFADQASRFNPERLA
jgi:hypothetical protein